MLKISDIPEDQILFYDIETTSVFAPYTECKMIGIQEGFKGEPFLVETPKQRRRFKEMLLDPDVIKVSYNGMNFDNIVLYRHGMPQVEEGLHDMYLAMKAIAPHLPSFSMKFVSWYYFGDPHFPEMRLAEWLKRNKLGYDSMYQAPKEILGPYCLHDIVQTRRIFEMAWEIVQRPLHWDAYCLDLSQGELLRQIELEGGQYLAAEEIKTRIATLQIDKLGWESHAYTLSKGRVSNPNSGKQIGAYLASEGFVLDLTSNGDFSVSKEDLLDIVNLDDSNKDLDPVARCTYEVRKINASLKYFENYNEALNANADSLTRNWIPKQFSISNARTRRYTSNSQYKLNFQNPNAEAKSVQVVPDGYLGVWIDSTQVENVVHIYESNDKARRRAYEADPKWNEYVWLCNQILGGNRGKEELDNIPSPQFPQWTIYKQFKTVKLALNFGMGLTTFCEKSGVDKAKGSEMFETVHEACPAIKELQRMVAERLLAKGYVQDVFGHIYTGKPRQAYKVVAYLIQGTGTASLPKAQLRANYDTVIPVGGILSGTTHDETELRLPLSLGRAKIIATLQELMVNMTDKFSYKFDNIPLRAKMYLANEGTRASDHKEFDITDLKGINKYIKI